MSDLTEPGESEFGEESEWLTDPDGELYEEQEQRPRRARRILGILALLLIVGGAVLFVYVQRQFSGIERVEVAAVLSPDTGTGTNYLIVGSDSRENLDRDVENAGAIFGDGSEEIGGQRTDTIQILRIADDGTQHILALPRDLYLPIGGDGAPNRINAAYAFGGPELLISTIQGSLGIPIHHYAEVDFAGFIDLVDAVGGVTINFPNPAYDERSGLNIPEAGPTKLGSAQALAFVRSRNFTQIIDGQAVVDNRGDLGRVKRQQTFLKALFAEVSGPIGMASVAGQLGDSTGSVKLDNRLSFTEAVSLAGDLRGFEPNSEWDLVVANIRTSSGAQVLQLDIVLSQPVLDFFAS